MIQTRGYFSGTSFWKPKSGQRIIGSGIGVTTLKLVYASTANAHYSAIGVANIDSLDTFEASDFTVDCNLPGQPITPNYDRARLACGAINVGGRHLRIRRIRAINFGTQGYGPQNPECFVITSGGAHPADPLEAVDCVIEDCIIEQPSPDNTRETTCIAMTSQEGTDGIMAYHRACVVRNCSINCEFQDRPLPIKSIGAPAGGVSTVETQTPHGLASGQWIRINGATLTGAPKNGFDNGYNGSFTVNSIIDSVRFTYLPNNPVPTSAPAGDMWAGRYPSHYVAIVGITNAVSGSEWEVTVTTDTAHFLAVGSMVLVASLFFSDLTLSPMNGVWIVSAVVDRKKFKYRMSINPGSDQGLNFSFPFIGVTFQAVSIDGGSEAVMEGNRVFNCRFGGPWHDTFSTKSWIARKNHYRAVVTGPYQNMGLESLPTPAATLTHVGLIATFTINSTKPHGFTKGQGVRIQGAKIGGSDPPLGTYNDVYKVESVPTPTSFTYKMVNQPVGNADPNTGTVRALWQVQECVIENNVIELIPSINYWGPPRGIALLASPAVDMKAFRVFRRLVIRNNVIRYVDNLTESIPLNLGIQLSFCEDALVQDNVVDLAIADPIRHWDSTTVKYFNNTNPAGQLIQGVLGPPTGPSVKQDELTTVIEDAATLCLL